jgi:hypothetical protein
MRPHSAFAGRAAKVFRTKGLVYQGAVDFWEQRVPGGSSAVREAMVDTGQTGAADLFAQRFVPGAWYPVMPILPSAVAAARLRRIPVASHVRENSVWLAERDLRGVYKVILSVASVEAVAMRLGSLSMRYFDFGSADTRKVAPGVIESDRVGIPAALGAWFTWCAEAFIPVALRLAGAKTVAVHAGTPQSEGNESAAGVANAEIVPTVRLRFRIEWT